MGLLGELLYEILHEVLCICDELSDAIFENMLGLMGELLKGSWMRY